MTKNSTTATTLQTSRTINGVAFNGSANITVADSTKLPTSGGTLTGQLVSTTVSFNLPDGVSLSDATAKIDSIKQEIGVPNDVFTSYGGTAAIFEESQGNTGLLILAAVITFAVMSEIKDML